MKLRLSAVMLAIGSSAVMALGVYFALLRPTLLADDVRYLDRTAEQLHVLAPAMTSWLRDVFLVMGGYMFATGLVTFYVAITTFRTRARGAATVATIAGVTSVGGTALAAFLIDSTFKWHALLLALLWAVALAFYQLEGNEPASRSSAAPIERALRR